MMFEDFCNPNLTAVARPRCTVTHSCRLTSTTCVRFASPGQKVLSQEELEDVECLEGDTAVFRFRICPSDFSGVKWYLDETLLYTNQLNEIQVGVGGYHTLVFRQLARKDTGTISFEAGSKRSYASLSVRGNSLRPSPSLQKLDI